MKHSIPFLLLLTVLINSCISPNSLQNQGEQPRNNSRETFNQYWYGGQAELTSYDLKQYRYGEERIGDAVLVFVSEDFILKQQVKKDYESNNPDISVLKLNSIKKFNTGIYDYSLMSSTFTPINQEILYAPLKVSTSTQEWCGHSWLQLNQQGKFYELSGYSYFQIEADQKAVLPQDLLEDGLWGQTRINPEQIPLGEQKVIPSTQYLRLAHKPIQSYAAKLSNEAYDKNDMPGNKLMSLKVEYLDLERSLEIVYEADFPHEIIGWKENFLNESSASKLQAIAVRKAKLMSDYWNKNSLGDTLLRQALKLEPQIPTAIEPTN